MSKNFVAKGRRGWHPPRMQRHVFGTVLICFLGCGETGVTTVTTTVLTQGTSNGPSPTNGTSATDSGSSGDLPTSGESASTQSSSSAHDPMIVSLQTNVTQVTIGQSVIFTAVVTDPDGLDDIAGGTLSSLDGAIGYGPFMAAGQPGTYTIEISWDAMQQAESIDFLDSELLRSFRVKFFDQAAHDVTETVELTLFCAEGSACKGVCVDIAVDSGHCGACENVCKDTCADAACLPALGECINEDAGFSTCNDYCASVGEACMESGCASDDTIVGYGSLNQCKDGVPGTGNSEPCDTLQPWTANRAAVRCCCSDTQ